MQNYEPAPNKHQLTGFRSGFRRDDARTHDTAVIVITRNMVLIFERRACVCVMGRGGGGWGGVEVGSRRVWVFVGVQKKPTDFFAYKKVKN